MQETIAAPAPRRRLAPLALIALIAALAAIPGLFALPPLDRDEARFAQATAQMLETGDFINIRFQEAERNKKPVGIHWLQAASVAAFSDVAAREIWAYRLPSALGAVLAAMFTYLAGARLFGASTGFLGALLLIAAPTVAGEATIAKTDAFLLAAVCAAQAAFIHIYAGAKDGAPAGRAWPLLFWIALGAGVLIKGPIAPMIVGAAGLAMVFRDPRFPWASAFRPVTGVLIVAAIVAPWAVAIGLETEGRFFTDAIGGDMLGKVGAAQERHGGPPGYHAALVWILFWPAAALIIPALAHAVAARRAWSIWFLAGWLVPSWLVFEITATKLPHYAMPLYPALAILAARATALGEAGRRRLARRIGAGVYTAIGLAAAAGVAVLPLIFAAPETRTLCFISAAAIAIGTGVVGALFWTGRARRGAYGAAGLSLFLALTLLDGVLPQLDRLMVSTRLSDAIDAADLHALRDGAPATALAGYYEPSAVFLLGTATELTDGAGAARRLLAAPGAAAAVEARLDDDFQRALSEAGRAPRSLAVIDGLNYSNGRDVRLTVYTLQ